VQFKILTYNIHRAIGLDRRFRLDRVVEILDHHQADIALLQEVDSGAPRSREMDLAKELAEASSYPHYAVGHNVTLRKGRYGNATLSRYPILRERNIDLTVGGRKRRGCQHTTILVERPGANPRELEVFNLHLGLSARERQRQVGLLARSNEFTSLDPNRSCIVGGDFNDWRGLLSPMFVELMAFQCATGYEYGSHQPLRTYPSFSPTGSLDKVFYRGGIRAANARVCRLRVSRVASDHLPVIVDLELV
jgi:endonuclease/exonuclease/phosphatase family metal-dependent hydrolase